MYRCTRIVRGALVFLAVGALAPASFAATSSDKPPVKIAWSIAETGPFAPYGLPATHAAELAVKDINEHGGVLGRKLELVHYDTQSTGAVAVAQAHKISDTDDAAVFGTLFTSTRTAILPIFKRAHKLYFYTENSEGGVCTQGFFNGNIIAEQQIRPMLKYMAEEKGLKKWYILAADYSFGRVSAAWTENFAKDLGAKIVGKPDFVSLVNSDFTSTITKIQASGADMILAVLVGPAELNFYKQWAASGLNKSTTIVSTAYGEGAEEITLGGTGKGIYGAYSYLPTANFPEPGNTFAAAWKASDTKLPMESGSPVTTWDSIHLWAMAVNKAGSLKNDAVEKELETGKITFEGPTGKVWFDGPTHQIVTPMILYQDNGKSSFDLIKVLTKAAEPTFLQSKCNLIKNPGMNEHFLPPGTTGTHE